MIDFELSDTQRFLVWLAAILLLTAGCVAAALAPARAAAFTPVLF